MDFYDIELVTSAILAEPAMETDEELRQRIIYVAVETETQYTEIAHAKVHGLDEIAARYGLRRREK